MAKLLICVIFILQYILSTTAVEYCWPESAYLFNGTCFPCEPGTYNPTPFGKECIDCRAGKYAVEAYLGDCISCPSGKSSDAGAASCSDLSSCQRNFYGDAGECVACPEGGVTWYTGRWDISACICGNGYGSSGTAPGVPCSICTPGTWKEYIGQDSCADCAMGKYKTRTGRGWCLPCPIFTYKNVTGHGECTPCPVLTTSYEEGNDDITDCKCNKGYTSEYEGAECVACPWGTYKDTGGSDECTLCPANTYGRSIAATSDFSCSGCHANSNSPPGSTNQVDCVCNAGHSYAFNQGNLLCTACPVGTYKTPAVNGACSSCAVAPPGLSCVYRAVLAPTRTPGGLACAACVLLAHTATPPGRSVAQIVLQARTARLGRSVAQIPLTRL